jgi:hypothetical protein
MSGRDEWSPDETSGTETFEQGDEALDEGVRTDAGYLEDIENDPSIDPAIQADQRELEEAGVELDDPEVMVTLEGGSDDPDGVDGASNLPSAPREEEEGWDLDAPVTRGSELDGDTVS